MTLLAFALLLLAAVIGYLVNWRAARAIREGGQRLHSLMGFHGLFSLLMILVPVLTVLLLWLGFEGPVINRMILASLPAGELEGLGSGAIQLISAEIRSIAGGRIFGTPEDWKLDAADRLIALRTWSDILLVVVVVILSLGILLF